MFGQGGEKGQASLASCVADAAAFDDHSQYCRRMVSVSLFKPTWELLLATMPPRPARPMPVLYSNLVELTDEAEGVSEAQRFKIRRVTCSTLSWEQNLACYMAAAIRKWVGVILLNPPAFDLGQKTQQD